MEITETQIIEAITVATEQLGNDRLGLRMVEIKENCDLSDKHVERVVKHLVNEGVLKPRRIKFTGFNGRISSGVEYVLVKPQGPTTEIPLK